MLLVNNHSHTKQEELPGRLLPNISLHRGHNLVVCNPGDIRSIKLTQILGLNRGILGLSILSRLLICGRNLILGQHREPISGDTRLARSIRDLNSRHMINGFNSREGNSYGVNNREDNSHGVRRRNSRVVNGRVSLSKVKNSGVTSGVLLLT